MTLRSPLASPRRRRAFSLGGKLGASFGALALLTVLLGCLGLQRMGAMDRSMSVVRDNYLPSIVAANRLAVSLSDVRRWQAAYMMSEGPNTPEGRLSFGNMRDAIAAVVKARADYTPLIDAGEEQRHFDTEFDPNWALYREKVEQSAAALDQGRRGDAVQLFRDGRQSFAALHEMMNWDLDYSRRSGQAAAQESRVVYATTWWVLLTGLVVATLVAVSIAVGMIRHISGPIVAMTAAMGRLAGRDMTVLVPCAGRGDEIGAMAAAVGVFKENMIRADALAAAEQRDLLLKQERAQKLDGLIAAFETKVGQMVGIVAAASTELEHTAQEMSATVERTGQQSGLVAEAARDADRTVQTAAAASEELAASIQAITTQVAAGSEQAGRVAENARRTDGVVSRLAESSDRVGQIVELISSIAAQTNLLALNATIEAARAGEAGKGFAVVASEVKSLAQQTAKATEGVGQQVVQIREATGAAVAALASITSGIDDINKSSVMIAAAVEQQGAASGEIARSVQQTAGSTRTVTNNIVEVSRAAQSNGAAATQVRASAGELSQQAEMLNREVSQFLRLVKAA